MHGIRFPNVIYFLTQTNGFETSEDGSKSFIIGAVLDSKPQQPVEFAIDVSDSTEAKASVKSLKIEPSRWEHSHNVKFTGLDDSLDDGSVPYNVTFTMDSADLAFSAKKHSAQVIECVNIDDEVSEILVSFGSNSSDAGNDDGFRTTGEGPAMKWLQMFVKLSSQPTSFVDIHIRSHDVSEGLLSRNQVDMSSNVKITFAPAMWNVSQTVYVMGVDDDIADGDQYYEISVTPATNDGLYALASTFVTIVNHDDDFANVLVGAKSGNLDTTESSEQSGQHSWTFDVQLATQPFFPVIINIKSTDTSEGKVSKNKLEFPAGKGWNKLETIQVSGVDDDLIDGNQEFKILLEITSSDEAYDAMTLDSFKSTNLYVDVYVSSGELRAFLHPGWRNLHVCAVLRRKAGSSSYSSLSHQHESCNACMHLTTNVYS